VTADLYTNQCAGELLRAILGGTVVPTDVPGASAGTHDFDIQLDDGRTIAVEVTISADRDKVQFWHEVHKPDWEAPQLSQSWMLNVTPPARVRSLRGKVEHLLQGLERAGIHKFGLSTKVDANACGSVTPAQDGSTRGLEQRQNVEQLANLVGWANDCLDAGIGWIRLHFDQDRTHADPGCAQDIGAKVSPIMMTTSGANPHVSSTCGKINGCGLMRPKPAEETSGAK